MFGNGFLLTLLLLPLQGHCSHMEADSHEAHPFDSTNRHRMSAYLLTYFPTYLLMYLLTYILTYLLTCLFRCSLGMFLQWWKANLFAKVPKRPLPPFSVKWKSKMHIFVSLRELLHGFSNVCAKVPTRTCVRRCQNKNPTLFFSSVFSLKAVISKPLNLPCLQSSG